jgi:hypothetical protein
VAFLIGRIGEMNHVAKLSIPMSALALALATGSVAEAIAANPPNAGASGLVIAQAMVPPTGMMDAQHPMPMNERYLRRFPQPISVGDLIGLPVLDLDASTLGYVRRIVRTREGKIDLIVSYSRWWGWFGRPVVVPLEVVGIEGRQLVSLDMPPREYAAAPTWEEDDAQPLPADATIKIALARN